MAFRLWTATVTVAKHLLLIFIAVISPLGPLIIGHIIYYFRKIFKTSDHTSKGQISVGFQKRTQGKVPNSEHLVGETPY